MTYIILLDFQIILFFINFISKNFKIIFIGYYVINYIIVYYSTIVLDIMNKVNNSIKF